MIVAVEGPSAAGKTTWTAGHCDPAVIVAETSAAQAAAGPDQREYPREAADALEASRPFFDAGRLGLADLILVAIPDRDTLVRCRDGDGSRQRATSISTSSSQRRSPSGTAQSNSSIPNG